MFFNKYFSKFVSLGLVAFILVFSVCPALGVRDPDSIVPLEPYCYRIFSGTDGSLNAQYKLPLFLYDSDPDELDWKSIIKITYPYNYPYNIMDWDFSENTVVQSVYRQWYTDLYTQIPTAGFPAGVYVDLNLYADGGLDFSAIPSGSELAFTPMAWTNWDGDPAPLTNVRYRVEYYPFVNGRALPRVQSDYFPGTVEMVYNRPSSIASDTVIINPHLIVRVVIPPGYYDLDVEVGEINLTVSIKDLVEYDRLQGGNNPLMASLVQGLASVNSNLSQLQASVDQNADYIVDSLDSNFSILLSGEGLTNPMPDRDLDRVENVLSDTLQDTDEAFQFNQPETPTNPFDGLPPVLLTSVNGVLGQIWDNPLILSLLLAGLGLTLISYVLFGKKG